jgi:hypothetical protein
MTVVCGDIITRRAEAVPVECCADLNAIGERHRCGTIPRLHHAGVEFVEILLKVRHVFVTFPRLGNHHHHGMGKAPAG